MINNYFITHNVVRIITLAADGGLVTGRRQIT